MGLGRSGERVANTPCKGLRGFFPGWVFWHVSVRLMEPGENPNVHSRFETVESSDVSRPYLQAGMRRLRELDEAPMCVR
jgi:hypothetical protein